MAPQTNRAQFRVEHVARKPRGWRVRTRLQGAHRIRIAFPPGPRRKGAGEVVEILHPKGERNPDCKVNPAELVIFGNPKKRRAHLTPAQNKAWESAFAFHVGEGKSDSQADRLAWRDLVAEFPELKKFSGAHPNPAELVIFGNPTESRLIRKSLHRQLEEAAKARGESFGIESFPDRRIGYRYKGELLTPGQLAERLGVRWPNPTVPEQHQIKIAKQTLKMPDAMVGVMGGMTKEEAREILRRHGIRFTENPGDRIDWTAEMVDRLTKDYQSMLGAGWTKENAASEAIRRSVAGPGAKKQFLKSIGLPNPSLILRNARWIGSPKQMSERGKAANLGYPFMVGKGRIAKNNRTWLYQFNQLSDGSGKSIFLGWDQQTKKWVKETGNPDDAPNDPKGYAKRVRELEAEGMTTSDAQAVADAEFQKKRSRRNPDSATGKLIRSFGLTRDPFAGSGTIYDSIRHGSRVTIVDRFGQQRTGRAVMLGPAGWVLNMGGAHGTPALASPSNVVKVSRGNPRPDFDNIVHLAYRWQKSAPDCAAMLTTAMTPGEMAALAELNRRGNPDAPLPISKFWRGAFRMAGLTEEQYRRALELMSRGMSPGSAIAEVKGRPVPRRNPDAGEERQAVQLFQQFHGRDPKGIVEKHVSDAMRRQYTALGALDYIIFRTDSGAKATIDFEGDGVTLASSPAANQLYFIGGNQNISSCLGKFTDDPSKDFIDLGEAVEVQYLARKAQGNFEPVKYFHKFGEEKRGSELPRGIYDKIRKQIFLAGGEYTIESPGIIN